MNLLIYSVLIVALGIAIAIIYQSKKAEKNLKRQAEELNFIYLQHVQSEAFLRNRAIELENQIEQLNAQQESLIAHKEHIEKVAYFDDLTQLPNRHSLRIDVEQLIEQTSKNILKGAVLFIDFDNFKSINDHYGHSVGDRLLILVASKLSQSIEGHGKVYRFGSDEFIALLDSVNDIDSIEFLAQKLQSDFSSPLSVMDNPFTLKFSMGISLLPIHANTFDELIGCADMAMYYAKRKGKGQYAFYKEESDVLKEELIHLKNNLQEAVENKKFDFLFQPILNRKSGKIALVETTLLWENEASRIPPPRMIQLANELDILANLNGLVIEAACDMADTLKSFDALILTTFNLSMHDLSCPTLIGDFKRILDQKNVDPSTICIEIKGSSVESNYEQILKQMEDLKSMGLRLIVDDFASEFMSLNFLKKMSVDFIKIDYGILFENEIVITSLLEIVKTLGIQIIIKNVEDRESAEKITSEDFHYVQGFFYSMPLQKENFIKLMHDEEIKIYPKVKKLAQTP